jgi:hypothetical protein
MIQWYHPYLQHPGEAWLEETFVAVVYWKSTRSQIRKHVKTCDRCQVGKRHKREMWTLSSKTSSITPWKQVHIDQIGPFDIKAKLGEGVH